MKATDGCEGEEGAERGRGRSRTIIDQESGARGGESEGFVESVVCIRITDEFFVLVSVGGNSAAGEKDDGEGRSAHVAWRSKRSSMTR